MPNSEIFLPIRLRFGLKLGIWSEDEKSLNGLLEPKRPPADWLPDEEAADVAKSEEERLRLPGWAVEGRVELSVPVLAVGMARGAGVRAVGTRRDWLFFKLAPPEPAELEPEPVVALVGSASAPDTGKGAAALDGLLLGMLGGGNMAFAALIGDFGRNTSLSLALLPVILERSRPTGYDGGLTSYRLNVMLLPGYAIIRWQNHRCGGWAAR